MKLLSLKLREEIFKEVERMVRENQTSRNAYINEALSFYNKLNRRKLLQRQLRKESSAVGSNSLRILEEFEQFEDDLP